MQAAAFERSIAGEEALPGRRFAIYRNNIASALIGALAVRYPVAERLVGREFFAAMASEFAREHRPQSPVFARYGGEFPDFIESFAPAASVPYLADVSRLESAWWQAYHAEDRTPLTPDDFEAIDPHDLGTTCFAFLPSAAIVRSCWPIVAIWTANRGDGDPRPIDLESGETALVARPGLDVTVRTIAPAQADFIGHLMAGRTLMQAVEITSSKHPAYDCGAALELLIGARVVHAFNQDMVT